MATPSFTGAFYLQHTGWLQKLFYARQRVRENVADDDDERNQTEAAYSRSDLPKKRRAFMNDWAAFAWALRSA